MLLQRLRDAALAVMKVPKPSEGDALTSSISHLASNSEALLVVLLSLGYEALFETEVPKVAEGDALGSALPHLTSNLQGLLVMLRRLGETTGQMQQPASDP